MEGEEGVGVEDVGSTAEGERSEAGCQSPFRYTIRTIHLNSPLHFSSFDAYIIASVTPRSQYKNSNIKVYQSRTLLPVAATTHRTKSFPMTHRNIPARKIPQANMQVPHIYIGFSKFSGASTGGWRFVVL